MQRCSPHRVGGISKGASLRATLGGPLAWERSVRVDGERQKDTASAMGRVIGEARYRMAGNTQRFYVTRCGVSCTKSNIETPSSRHGSRVPTPSQRARPALWQHSLNRCPGRLHGAETRPAGDNASRQWQGIAPSGTSVAAQLSSPSPYCGIPGLAEEGTHLGTWGRIITQPDCNRGRHQGPQRLLVTWKVLPLIGLI